MAKKEKKRKGESARMKRKKKKEKGTSIDDWKEYSNCVKTLLFYREIYLIPSFKILILMQVYAHV